MALESRFYIGMQNELDNLGLTSDVAADANYPIANMLNDVRGEPTRWDMSVVDFISVKGSKADQFSLTGLLMKGHNFASETKPRFRIFDKINQTGKINFDSATNVYGNLPGAVGDYFSTPDSVAASITGSIDIRVRLNADTWNLVADQTLISKWNSSQSYMLRLEDGNRLRLWIYDGTTQNSSISSSLSISTGTHWVRAKWNVSTGVVTFEKSDSAEEDSSDIDSWTEISTGSIAVASILDGGDAVEIGSRSGGGTEMFTGKIYRAQIYNGIDGTLAVDFDARSYTKGTSFVSNMTGETWTINGASTIKMTLPDIYTQAPWGENIAGIDPWINYYDPNSNLDTVYSLTFGETLVGKSIQLDLLVPTPTNNIAEIDKLAAFWAWSPQYNYDYGSGYTIEEDTEQYKMSSGGLLVPGGPARRAMDLDFSLLPDTESNVLLHILERAKKSGDLYVIANPNWTGYSKYLSTGIFKRIENASKKAIRFNGNDLALMLRES